MSLLKTLVHWIADASKLYKGEWLMKCGAKGKDPYISNESTFQPSIWESDRRIQTEVQREATHLTPWTALIMSQRSQDRILLLQYPMFLHLKCKQTVTQNVISHSQLATAIPTWHSQSHYSPSMFSPSQACSHCCCWRTVKQGEIILYGQRESSLVTLYTFSALQSARHTSTAILWA